MKSAPFECPKCGEEKGWKCLNDPSASEMSRGKQAVIQAGFGLLGVSIAKAFHKGKPLKYRCDKCGYEATFKPD